ncbi:hypothetical protein BRC64_03590 [Halobacteriales archaeon QH_10_67_22]|nr:MAG: hypothetical protein BRC64_03590 [Halobacteriales archaeon QH_10_67_22]
MSTYELFGPLDSVLGSQLVGEVLLVEVVLLGLLFANMGARALAHRRHVSQADDGGAEAISRHPAHTATNLLLVLGAFYYLTLAPHAGMVTSVIVVGVVLTDIFEFESRKVEARRDLSLDAPKAAVAGSLLALVYLMYVTLFSGPLGQFL